MIVRSMPPASSLVFRTKGWRNWSAIIPSALRGCARSRCKTSMRLAPSSSVRSESSAVGTVDIADERFEAFWSTCERLDAVVFLHPERFPGAARLSAHRLVFSTGYPSETGIVAAQLIMSGFFTRHPKIRFVLAHGGGTLPWLLPRLDQVWSSFEDLRLQLPRRPSEAARSFLCDTLTYDAENLSLVIERIGIDRLMLGSDYPFPLMEDPPGKAITMSASLSDDEKARLSGANAERLLRGG